jgi:PKD repeat protein
METIKFKLALAGIITIVLASCTKEPSPDFSFDNNNATVPVTVNFTNQTTDGESYSWNFGDGGVSTEGNPSHLYTTAGEFYITLKATNGKKSQSITKAITLLTPTTFSILNSTSNIVISGIISAYYDSSQGTYIDLIQHGTLAPGERTASYETTYSSRTIFFSGASNTLLRVKDPYPLTKNAENTLALYDNTIVVVTSLSKDIVKTNKPFSEKNRVEAPAELMVQISGSKRP